MTLLRTAQRTTPRSSLFLSLAAVLISAALGCAGGPRTSEPGPPPPPPKDGSTLVLFVTSDGSPAAEAIERDAVPMLTEIATEFGSVLEGRDVSVGAPEEIAGTPLLVYQNHLGRSQYVGRFTTPDRIRAFMRTAQRIPQSASELVRTEVAVLAKGRATIAAPFKITDLAGAQPSGFDAEAFRSEMARALARGMTEFTVVDRVALARSDRSIYVDVYPYRADDGWLYLSGAAFSQFHCHEPRWRFSGEDLAGSFDDRAALFEEAGRRFQAEIARILSEPGGEDVYRPLAANVPVRSWSEIGLDLPPEPPNAPPAIGTGALPTEWVLESAEGAAVPPVTFRFPAPLDSYNGAAPGASGTLSFSEGESFSGSFEVATSSVTMGEPDLDAYIHGSQVLRVKEQSSARFDFQGGVAIGGVEWGKSTPITVPATFTMLQTPVAVTAVGTVTPDLDRAGNPRLVVEASFEVAVYERFGIRGPDGPDEARNNLIFNIEADLRPRE